MLGIGRGLAYELARSGGFPVPVIRCGRRLVVPAAALDELLGLSEVRGCCSHEVERRGGSIVKPTIQPNRSRAYTTEHPAAKP
jgi:hypothetical protein